jgi:hypothetical protein
VLLGDMGRCSLPRLLLSDGVFLLLVPAKLGLPALAKPALAPVAVAPPVLLPLSLVAAPFAPAPVPAPVDPEFTDRKEAFPNPKLLLDAIENVDAMLELRRAEAVVSSSGVIPSFCRCDLRKSISSCRRWLMSSSRSCRERSMYLLAETGDGDDLLVSLSA